MRRCCTLNLLLLMLAVLLMPLPARAQDAAVTPPPDYLQTRRTFILFPEGIFSYYVLSRPGEDFAAFELRVTQPGWAGDETLFAPDQIVRTSDPFTDVFFTWSIPQQNPPRLFEDLTITWRFIDNSGSIGSYSVTLPFSDTRTDWTVESVGPLTLAVPEGRLSPALVSARLTEMVDLLRREAGAFLVPNIAVYDSLIPADPCTRDAQGRSVITASDGVDASLFCSARNLERLYASAGYSVVQLANITPDSLTRAAAELFVESAYGARWAAADVPDWFQVGLAAFVAPTDKRARLDQARSAARVGGLFNDMQPVPDVESAAYSLWSAQSYGLVLFIAEQVGVDGLFALARDLSAEQDLAAAYRARSGGESLAALIPAWQSWLFSVQAETAYQYNPYLATTPTPTATLSATPFPATPTPTPTVTLTPSVTPTVTGVLSPTPRPPGTPTLTLTPSITPRPPTAFVPPTAPPTPIESVGPLLLILGLGVVLGGAVIVLFGLILPRRRKTDSPNATDAQNTEPSND